MLGSHLWPGGTRGDSTDRGRCRLCTQFWTGDAAVSAPKTQSAFLSKKEAELNSLIFRKASFCWVSPILSSMFSTSFVPGLQEGETPSLSKGSNGSDGLSSLTRESNLTFGRVLINADRGQLGCRCTGNPRRSPQHRPSPARSVPICCLPYLLSVCSPHSPVSPLGTPQHITNAALKLNTSLLIIYSLGRCSHSPKNLKLTHPNY